MTPFLAGLSVALVSVSTIAITSGIAAPATLFTWFRAHGAIEVGLFLWDLTVVFGLGFGLLASLTLVALYRRLVSPSVQSAACFLVGALATFHGFIPLVNGTPLSLAISRPWWGYGLEVALLLAVLAAIAVSQRSSPFNAATSRATTT